jgi:plasmid maintenance system antidote protein VapI
MSTPTSTGESPLTDVLKQSLKDSELSLFRLASETGIARASLIRFTCGETSLRLDIADRLARYFRLALVPAKKQRIRKRG